MNYATFSGEPCQDTATLIGEGSLIQVSHFLTLATTVCQRYREAPGDEEEMLTVRNYGTAGTPPVHQRQTQCQGRCLT